jgi:hypothetical protein
MIGRTVTVLRAARPVLRPRTLMTAEGAVLREEIPVLEMVEPLAGFREHRRFALARLDEAGVLCALRSLDDADALAAGTFGDCLTRLRHSL